MSRLLELRKCLLGLQRTFARSPSARRSRAARITRRALGITEGLVVADEGCATLWLGRDAQWFQLEGQERVNLQRRRALPGIVAALAAAAPHAALSSEAVLRAGWPDERMGPEAAAMRVRAAIATLRRLGLRDVLMTTASGYRLDVQVLSADAAG